MLDNNTAILALDRAGNPCSWISLETAVGLVVAGRVIAPLGEVSRVVLGGTSRATGRRSTVEVSSILLTSGRVSPRLWSAQYTPPLSNRALFARDRNTCQYCGGSFHPRHLTRDHVVPRCRGGEDTWANAASACMPCNSAKGGRTPEAWGVQLLSVPYAPCYAEHLLLSGRRVLADQAAFIRTRVRRKH